MEDREGRPAAYQQDVSKSLTSQNLCVLICTIEVIVPASLLGRGANETVDMMTEDHL